MASNPAEVVPEFQFSLWYKEEALAVEVAREFLKANGFGWITGVSNFVFRVENAIRIGSFQVITSLRLRLHITVHIVVVVSRYQKPFLGCEGRMEVVSESSIPIQTSNEARFTVSERGELSFN